MDRVTVHRVRDALINASTRVSPAAAADTVPHNDWRTALRTRLRNSARWIWRATYWPDYACGWILPASKAARKLCQDQQYDWIVSVSHPFSGHVVGWITQKHARGARWFVDIGDPFHLMEEPSPNNRRLYAHLNRWIETRVLALADAISVTTESTQLLYAAHFPSSRGRIHLMPPLLSLPPASAATDSRLSRHVFRLVFVGTLYRRLRSPVFLLQCFSALIAAMPDRDLELHIYGAVNDCGEELAACPEPARARLFVHGVVERAVVHVAMLEADLLVNIGNDSTSQLASKVIEYMSVGKPILNIVSSESDTSLSVLADYPAMLTLTRSAAPSGADVEALRAFVGHPPLVHPTVVACVRAQYSAQHVAKLYRLVFEQQGDALASLRKH